MRTLLSLAAFLAVTAAPAATITVTSDSPSHNVAADCVLRDAITAANTDTAVGGCTAGNGADTIALPSGASIGLTEFDNVDLGQNGLPVITSTITIEGNGATIAGAGGNCGYFLNPQVPPDWFRILRIAAVSGDLTLHHLTITQGCVGGDASVQYGGGIYNGNKLTLDHVVMSQNGTAVGGAIYSDGALSIDHSNFIQNHCSIRGCAIADSANGHDTVIDHSSFVNGYVEGFPVRGEGAGIDHDTGTLNVRNSTFANNSAWLGGALRLHSGPTFLSNVTMAGNSSGGPPLGQDAGGMSSSSTGTNVLTVTNSLLSNSTLFYSDCSFNAGYLKVIGQNLSSDASCAGFSLSSTDPQLSALSSNGGNPQYFEPQPGSPAIDGASSCLDAAGTATITDDERGRPRPYGSACDLGAYERDDFLFANGFEL